MKKLIAVVLALVLLLSLLAACGSGNPGNNSNNDSNSNAPSSSGSGSGDSGDSGESTSPAPEIGSGNASAPEMTWAAAFGGSGFDSFNAVCSDTDGYVAVGFSGEESFGNGDWEGVSVKGFDNGTYEGADDGRRGGDAIIVKFDLNGEVVWKRSFGGAWSESFSAVCCDDDGYVAVGGTAQLYHGDWNWINMDGYGEFMVKFDKNGEVVWKKPFSGGGDFNAIIAVNDGYVTAGSSGGYNGSMYWDGLRTNGRDDGIIAKFDKNGDLLWNTNFGGSEYDDFLSLVEVSDGYVVVGNSREESFESGDWEGVPGKGGNDAIIVKFDFSGNVLWKKSFGGSGNDSFESVTQSSGGYVAVGYSRKDSFGNGDWDSVSSDVEVHAIMVKYDPNGNMVWKKVFGEDFEASLTSVIADGDGFVAAGNIASFVAAEATIARFDANGNVIWQKSFGGYGRDYFTSITPGVDGGYVASISLSDVSIEHHSDFENTAKKGSTDGIIIKLG